MLLSLDFRLDFALPPDFLQSYMELIAHQFFWDQDSPDRLSMQQGQSGRSQAQVRWLSALGAMADLLVRMAL